MRHCVSTLRQRDKIIRILWQAKISNKDMPMGVKIEIRHNICR